MNIPASSFFHQGGDARCLVAWAYGQYAKVTISLRSFNVLERMARFLKNDCTWMYNAKVRLWLLENT